jgi:hypothetical protein
MKEKVNGGVTFPGAMAMERGTLSLIFRIMNGASNEPQKEISDQRL